MLKNKTLIYPEWIVPALANGYGTLYAPNGLSILGKAAFQVATQYTGSKVVMASCRQADFLKPIPVNSIVMIKAEVVRIGTTSMTVYVSISLSEEVVLNGEFKMVLVDDNGKPKPIPKETDVE